jgi:hypothetical protein
MSRQNVSKREGLEITLAKFDKSVKGVNDYIELLVVANRALRPADGMIWEEVEEVINQMINKREGNLSDGNRL